MRSTGRLAVVLQSIVVSSLSACGGAAEGGQPGAANGGAGFDSGGSASGGRASAGGGSGGRKASAGAGGVVSGAGGLGAGGVVTGAGGLGTGGVVTGAGGLGAGGVVTGAGGLGTGGVVTGGQGGAGSYSRPSKPSCDDQGLLSFVAGLNLPRAVDYLGVYLNQTVGVNTLYQSTGTPCGGALDRAACQAALLSGVPTSGFTALYLQNAPSLVPPYSYMYLAYTRGDSVGFISDRAQLNALLGEIDTANEAGLVFLSMGFGPGCGAITETDDAYYFTTPFASGGCTISPPGRLFSVTRAGEVLVTPVGMVNPCVGRRPAGLLQSSESLTSPVADYYASIAHLEAAAVLAFEVIEAELSRFGAPHDLRVRARKAHADERRHAQRMTEFALRFQASVPCVRAAAASDRSLLAAALENAVEGCVREAWGALSAHYQAATAREPDAQRLWREIAADESEHAELSFALHDWYTQQLADDERALVEVALERARLELRVELAFACAPHPALVDAAGVPDPACAAALFRQLEAQVLSA